MKILATYNIKGGVGKTAAAVNLAWLSARSGLRTLVWDLDPQGAASFYFRIKPRVKGGGKKLVKGKQDLDDLIKGTDFANLDLLPADFSYRHMDLELSAGKKPEQRLDKLLAPLRGEYDRIFLDCPPSISLVSEAVFRTADLLLVPMIPTTLSLRTLEQLLAFRDRQKLKKLVILPFFSMVDRRKNLHRELVAELPERHQPFLTTAIPYASDVELMGRQRQPLGSFAGNRPAARAYAELWAEICGYCND